MGSVIYDFLSESFLFQDDLIRDDFRPMSDSELLAELQRYREFCLSGGKAVFSEVLSNPTELKAFSGLERVTIDQLKQSALYLHQYVINDPLLALTEDRSIYSQVMGEFLGFKSRSIDREDLAKRLMFLKNIVPMVVAGFVKLLPVSLAFEAPKEVRLNYSDRYFDDVLPAKLLKFFRDHAAVKSLRKTEGGWAETDDLFPCRGISISFRGHVQNPTAIYHYMDIASVEKREEALTLAFAMRMPDTPPALPVFEAWLRQSVNQAASSLYRKTELEATLATELGALYSTSSPFISDVLQQVYVAPDSIPVHTANVFLNMNLPFLRDMSLEMLMKVRQDEGEAFENFRVELDRQLRDLRTTDDPDQVRVKAENAVHELAEVQIRNINNTVAGFKDRAWVSAAVAAMSLATTVQTGGWSLLATAAAGIEGAKLAVEYRTQVKRHPAFFLWKVLKASEL